MHPRLRAAAAPVCAALLTCGLMLGSVPSHAAAPLADDWTPSQIQPTKNPLVWSRATLDDPVALDQFGRRWPGVLITGASNLEVGTVVVPWILFPEQTSYSEGIARVPVDDKGGFTWERRTRKEVTIYMAAGELVSNRVTVG